MKLGPQRFRPLGAPVRLRGAPPASICPASSRGSCCTGSSTSGSSMGKPADGPGGVGHARLQMATAYSAIAKRWSAPDAADRQVDRRQAGAVRRPATASSRRRRRRRCGTCSVACSPTAATASGAAIPPGWDLAGKTGNRQRGWSTANYSSNRLRGPSFIGFVPASHPRLLVAVMVEPAAGARSSAARVAAPGVPEDRRLGGPVLSGSPVRLAALRPPPASAAAPTASDRSACSSGRQLVLDRRRRASPPLRRRSAASVIRPSLGELDQRPPSVGGGRVDARPARRSRGRRPSGPSTCGPHALGLGEVRDALPRPRGPSRPEHGALRHREAVVGRAAGGSAWTDPRPRRSAAIKAESVLVGICGLYPDVQANCTGLPV